MRARANAALFATGCTLGLVLQAWLFGYYLGWWGTMASVALGVLEGRWAALYLLRRHAARIQR